MALMYPAGYTFLDSNGNPVASGSVYFYETGTETLKAVYTDVDLSVTAANPYSLDASGRFTGNQSIYGSGLYTVKVLDSTSALVFERDDVFGVVLAGDIESTVLPMVDGAYALGSAAKRFSEVHSEAVAADQYSVGDQTIISGAGTPEGVVSADPGSIFQRSDGDGDTTLYVKVSGTGNTGWQAVRTNILTGSKTHDFGSLADGAGETTTVTCTGAALGDYAQASLSVDISGCLMTAWVSSSNTVSVRLQNETGAGPIDLASGTLRVRVSKA